MDLTEKILSTEVVFKGRYLQTEVQTVRLPDGRQAKREIVVPPNAVAVLPLDTQSMVYLVRQYRTSIRQINLEVPAGVIEPDEDPLQTARRECAEETGMQPGTLKPLCSFFHSVGFSTGKIQLFLATDLTPTGGGPSLDSTEFLEVVRMPFEEFYGKIARGEIQDSKSIVAALWVHQHIFTND